MLNEEADLIKQRERGGKRERERDRERHRDRQTTKYKEKNNDFIQ